VSLDSLKFHFLDFGQRFYRIRMVRKRRHCVISEALANVFALQSEPGAGVLFGPLGLGAPGLARSEPIVVTPLIENKSDSKVQVVLIWQSTKLFAFSPCTEHLN
jgi:hypothetical protein